MVAQGRDADDPVVEDWAIGVFAHRHHRLQLRPALVLDPRRDVEAIEAAEGRPHAGEALWPIGLHLRAKARAPGGVDQIAEFEIMIGMVMRDEDRRKLSERMSGFDEAARHAQTAIDDIGPAIDGEQHGGGRRAAGADRRAALRTEDGERDGHGGTIAASWPRRYPCLIGPRFFQSRLPSARKAHRLPGKNRRKTWRKSPASKPG